MCSYLIFVIFLHSHILSRKFMTYLPVTVIFLFFFWNFFTLSQNFYTHGVPGVPDKYQVCSAEIGRESDNTSWKCLFIMVMVMNHGHWSTVNVTPRDNVMFTCSCVKPKLVREEVIEVGGEGRELVGSDSWKFLCWKNLIEIGVNCYWKQLIFCWMKWD